MTDVSAKAATDRKSRAFVSQAESWRQFIQNKVIGAKPDLYQAEERFDLMPEAVNCLKQVVGMATEGSPDSSIDDDMQRLQDVFDIDDGQTLYRIVAVIARADLWAFAGRGYKPEPEKVEVTVRVEKGGAGAGAASPSR